MVLDFLLMTFRVSVCFSALVLLRVIVWGYLKDRARGGWYTCIKDAMYRPHR
jgi:hypothetical protein